MLAQPSVRGARAPAFARSHPYACALAGVLLLALLACLLIRWAPDWLAQTGGLKADKAAEERGRVRTALLALLAGVLAVTSAACAVLTFGLTRGQQQMDRHAQQIDRYTRALDQLGSHAVDVQIGGIYDLGRLALERDGHEFPVVDVLTGYIRKHAVPASSHETGLAGPGEQHSVSPEVQAVISVLARRDVSYETERPTVDLSDANLGGVHAPGIHLDGALLTRAHLERAQLEGAHLRQATLVGAHLRQARLHDADLTGASLASASIEGADLRHAKGLETANLKGARFDFATQLPPGFDAEAAGAVRVRPAATADPP